MPKSKVVSLETLQRTRAAASEKPLTIHIELPAQAAAFYRAMLSVSQIDQVEFNRWVFLRGLTSEEAIEKFDQALDQLV